MPELIQKYLERFNESFPLFMVMGMEDAEVEALIRDCLDKGTPTTARMILTPQTLY